MRTGHELRWTGLLLLLLVLARSGSGQRGVQVTPFVGYYAPAFGLVDEYAPYFGQITVRHTGAVAFGGRLGIPISRRVVLEGIVAYSASGVEVVSTGLGNGSRDASVTVVGGQLAFQLSPAESPLVFHLTSGVARVSHGGRYWKDFESAVRGAGLSVTGTSRFGLLLGATLTFQVGSVPLRTGVDAMLYDSKFTFSDNISSGDTQSLPQADLHLFAGVVLGAKRGGSP